MKIAEEEIKRTSEEAVKEALLDVGGELAYESEKAKQFEEKNTELELFNKELQADVEELKQKNKNKFMFGALVGGIGGVLVTSLVFSLVNNFIK